jgi:hypothetical protein
MTTLIVAFRKFVNAPDNDSARTAQWTLLSYKNPPVNAVYGNNLCFGDRYKAHKYAVWAEREVFGC